MPEEKFFQQYPCLKSNVAEQPFERNLSKNEIIGYKIFFPEGIKSSQFIRLDGYNCLRSITLLLSTLVIQCTLSELTLFSERRRNCENKQGIQLLFCVLAPVTFTKDIVLSKI